MKISYLLGSFTVALITTITSCNQEDADPCTYPHQVTANSACYAGNGLQLTASDYGKSPLSFEWEIYALKDSSKILGWTPNDLKLRMIANNTFTVPDSLVNNYKRLIVNVASNCQGDLKHSISYGFIKRISAANCVTWISQNQ
ncbi:hypothetical protein [Spirosoma sp.]|uniref:hypothetical protein n=1 Tax=Spirosoma sp. TaxID=1899569 RepID=UPI003B3B2F08